MSLPYCEVWLGDRTTGTQLDDVQTVDFAMGRAKITDSYRSGNGSITGRNPNSLPTIDIGDTITVLAVVDTLKFSEYIFTVADIRFDYGISSEQDLWTITVEDVVALFGRSNIDVTWAANSRVDEAIEDVGTATGKLVYVYQTTHNASAQTLTNVNALQVLQTLANTDQGFFQVLQNELIYYPSRLLSVPAAERLVCSDSPTTGEAKFDRLVFSGLADNYVQQVIASGDGLTDAVAGSGAFNYQYSTYQETQSELQSNADYVLGALSVQTLKPTQISVNINANDTAAREAVQALFNRDAIWRIDIEFRGSTYQTVVLGWQLSSRPGSMRYTMNVVSTEFFAFLILDDLLFGQLDNNKLGF